VTPDEYCRERAAASGSSFYYSFLFLPPPRRRAITAFYAFCREVDDVVDEARDVGVARAKLAWWRTEVADLFAGRPTHPVTRALAPFIGTFGLDARRMGEIIDGMEMDLTRHRYADFDSLSLYCHRVAGVVGQVAASIFGYANPRTLEYADALGLAFQLTNIIRDVGEDARLGRVYLPADELARHGLTAEDILSLAPGPGFDAMIREQAARAQAQYDRALALLPPEDRRSQRAGLIMAAIYRTLLAEIESAGYPVLRARVSLTPIRKFWIAWKTWVTT
jgi:phytoene synthase